MKAFAKENVDEGLCEVILNFDLLYNFFSVDEIKNTAKQFGTSIEVIGIADDFCRVPIMFHIGQSRAMWITGRE